MTLAERHLEMDLQVMQVGSVFVSNYPPYSFWDRRRRRRGGQRRAAATAGGRRHARPLSPYPVLPPALAVSATSGWSPTRTAATCASISTRSPARWSAMPSCRGGGMAAAIHRRRHPLVHQRRSCASCRRACAPRCRGTAPRRSRTRSPAPSRAEAGGDPRHRRDAPVARRRELRRRHPAREERPRPRVGGDPARQAVDPRARLPAATSIHLIAGMVETYRAIQARTLEHLRQRASSTRWSCRSTRCTRKVRRAARAASSSRRGPRACCTPTPSSSSKRPVTKIRSAYTMLKTSRRPRPRFVYADAVWHGSDMVGAGVSAFSHIGGVHFQNADCLDDYLVRWRLASCRSRAPSSPRWDERLTRELGADQDGARRLLLLPAQVRRRPVGALRRAAAAVGVAGAAPDRRGGVRRAGRLAAVDQLLPEFYAPYYGVFNDTGVRGPAPRLLHW